MTATQNVSASALDLYRYVIAPTTTDLRDYVNGLIEVAESFETDSLVAAAGHAHELPAGAPVMAARFVFMGAIGHRLHGKPAVTYDAFIASGISPF